MTDAYVPVKSRTLEQGGDESQSSASQMLEARRAEHERQQREQGDAWAAELRRRTDELWGNELPAAGLHHLAQVYLGLFKSDGERRRARLSKYLGGDTTLVDAVLFAFRAAIRRPTVPSVRDAIELRKRSRSPALGLPVLIGLDLISKSNPSQFDELDDELKRKALALLFTVTSTLPSPPRWFERLVNRQPELVAEVAMRCSAAEVRNGASHVPALRLLDALGEFADIARAVVFRCLEAFPVRGSNAQLGLFDQLLHRSMGYPQEADLAALIDSKLECGSMTVAQRGRWLTAAALQLEEHYVERLAKYVRSHDLAVYHVARFLRAEDFVFDTSERRSRIERMKSPTIKAFVTMLGPVFEPTIEIERARPR